MGGQDHGALDDVLQLPHIARPVIVHQRGYRFSWNVCDALVHGVCILLGKVPHQQGNVVASLAQRRHGEREDVQAVVEIRSERVLLDHGEQIAVRRRHHTGIRAQRARGAEALERVVLQHPQELGLQFEGQVADFVEKEGPPVGQFKAPETLRERAREGAFFVAEEFAFQEVGREAGLDVDHFAAYGSCPYASVL